MYYLFNKSEKFSKPTCERGKYEMTVLFGLLISGRYLFTINNTAEKLATKFLCVNITPFGKPVVPLV